MEKLVNWLVFSSEDPKKAAMTIRGVLMIQVPLVLSFLHEMGVVSYDNVITKAVITATASLGILLVIFGLARKGINLLKDKPKKKKR